MITNKEKFFDTKVANQKGGFQEEDEDEQVQDVEGLEDVVLEKGGKKKRQTKEDKLAKKSKIQKPVVEEEIQQSETQKSLDYDPYKREPLFSNAQNSCLWELGVLADHYHPTVRKYIGFLFGGNLSQLDYKGNPLLDFSLANFLDRLSFKKARKKESKGM